MLIYKEELLNCTGLKVLKLPYETVEEAKKNIVKIGLQYGTPHMWFNIVDKPPKAFLLACVGTGHEHPELSLDEYIGSEIVCGGAFVWHYFLIDKPDMDEKMEKLMQISEEQK